jgi:hypothetical protein
MLHESLIWHRESRLIVVVVAAVVDHNFALLGHVRAGGPDRTLRRRHVRGRLRNEAERAHGGPRTQQRRQRVGPMGEVALQGRMGVEWMVVAGQRRHFQLLQLGLLKPLRFGAPVLEPDLHLGLREPQAARELRPLRYAEVLLIPELLLECQELLRGEGRPGLPVGLVLPQIALQLGRFPVGIDWNKHTNYLVGRRFRQLVGPIQPGIQMRFTHGSCATNCPHIAISCLCQSKKRSLYQLSHSEPFTTRKRDRAGLMPSLTAAAILPSTSEVD